MRRVPRALQRWIMLCRKTLLPCLCLAGACVAFAAACEPLPALDDCTPCEKDCPGDLECSKDGYCEKPGEEPHCGLADGDEPTSTATDSSSGSGGDGNVSDNGSGGSPAGGGESSSGPSVGGGPGIAGEAGGATNSGPSTAGGTAGAAGEVGDGGECDEQPARCLPELLTAPELPAACAGRPFAIQLKANCRCDGDDPEEREMSWEPVSLPEGATLTADGYLSGSLAAGHHELRVRAYFPPEFDLGRVWDLTLDVSDRCLVTFLSEAESPGIPRVAAVRVDTHELEGWMPEEPEIAVADYDISADGKYLAATVDGGATLQLFALGQLGVPNAEYEQVGTHLAHAFSPDSRWLAVVTTDPGDEDSQLLEIVSLDGETWDSVTRESVHYTDGLDWFGDGEVLLLGPDEGPPSSVIPQSWHVDSEGLDSVVEYDDLRIEAEDPLFAFLTGPKGFVTSNVSIQGYFDEASLVTRVYFYPIESISPRLSYRAVLEGDNVALRPLTWLEEDAAYATGEGCTQVRAWAEDEATLLCSTGSGYNLFDVEGEGELEKTVLDIEAYDWPSTRAALSASGDWLAFLPTEAGLQVVPRARFDEPLPDDPLLETRLGEWDFFFAPNEQRLVVQQGERLLVVPLEADGPGEPHRLSSNMGLVPECNQYWRAETSTRWCGTARVEGSSELSASQRYLAFHDVEDRVYLVDLDTMESVEIGALNSTCEGNCIQFQ